MNDPEELLDIAQAAVYLQVSETSLRRWTRSGRLPCLRVGLRRERRFRRGDLLAFLEAEPVAVGRVVERRRKEEGLNGGHLCGFYSSDHGRATLATAFLREGLEAGAVSFLVAAPEARTNILAYLRQARASIPDEVHAGKLVLSQYHASAQDQYDYFEDEFAKALRRDVTSLRVLGDLSGGALAHGRPFSEMIDYEAGYEHRIARQYPVTTLCLHDARQLSGVDTVGILKGHPATLRLPGQSVLA